MICLGFPSSVGGSRASARISSRALDGFWSPRGCLVSWRSCVTLATGDGVNLWRRNVFNSLCLMGVSPLPINHSAMQGKMFSGKAARTWSACVVGLVSFFRWNCISTRRNQVGASRGEKGGNLIWAAAVADSVVVECETDMVMWAGCCWSLQGSPLNKTHLRCFW